MYINLTSTREKCRIKTRFEGKEIQVVKLSENYRIALAGRRREKYIYL